MQLHSSLQYAIYEDKKDEALYRRPSMHELHSKRSRTLGLEMFLLLRRGRSDGFFSKRIKTFAQTHSILKISFFSDKFAVQTKDRITLHTILRPAALSKHRAIVPVLYMYRSAYVESIFFDNSVIFI